MKTIFDPSFRYTASFNTNLKKTFARIRRENRSDRAKAAPAPLASLAILASASRSVPQAQSPRCLAVVSTGGPH
jgi:hypothetical protein